MFWAWLTAGPLLMAFVLGQLSLAAALSAGWLGAVPGAAAVLVGVMLGLVYRVVPNTAVRWRDALAGGMLAAVAFNLASRVFAWYVGRLPTYASVYGTFATVPLVLIWICWSWLVVLGGALVSAWLPALRAGVMAPDPGAGGDFLLAVKDAAAPGCKPAATALRPRHGGPGARRRPIRRAWSVCWRPCSAWAGSVWLTGRAAGPAAGRCWSIRNRSR